MYIRDCGYQTGLLCLSDSGQTTEMRKMVPTTGAVFYDGQFFSAILSKKSTSPIWRLRQLKSESSDGMPADVLQDVVHAVC